MTQVCLRKLDPYLSDFDAWMKQETGMNTACSAIQQLLDEADDDRSAFEWFVEKFRAYQRTAVYRTSWTDDEPGGLSGAGTEPGI